MENEVQEKKNFKKYLPIIGIAVALIAIIVVLVVVISGNQKDDKDNKNEKEPNEYGVVEKYASAMSGTDVTDILDCIDLAGMSAWKYSYDVDDFSEEDYKEFIENYEDIDKDELEEAKDYFKENLKNSITNRDEEFKTYKMKVKEIKSEKELGKDLVAIEAAISLVAKPNDEDEDEIDETEDMTFVTYKDKIIDAY